MFMKTTIQGNPKPLSRVVMGAINISTDTYDESIALLDAAMERGINAFDLAHIYGGGKVERAFGRWMAERGNREDIFLITKCSHHNQDRKRVTPHDITSDLMDSLARLKTGYVDGYLFHRDDPGVPVGPLMDTLHEHVRAGRIKSFGGSNWTHTRIAEANAYAAARGQTPMTISSPNYGLCDQVDNPWPGNCVTISGEIGAEGRAFYLQQGIPVFAYSSLGHGMMSGRVTRENHRELLDGVALKAYASEENFAKLDRARELAARKGVKVAQIALAYTMCQPFAVFPLFTPGNVQELGEIAEAAGIKLTEAECRWLESGTNA
jgi:aryl-alcohol dehydrogenase-like predicted oxidoreductase